MKGEKDNCPLCRTAWKDITIPMPLHQLIALAVLTMAASAAFAVYATAIRSDTFQALLLGVMGTFVACGVIAVVREASIVLRPKTWFVFFDEADDMHLHGEDPRTSDPWKKWSRRRKLWFPRTMVSFVPGRPASGRVFVHGRLVTEWSRATYTRGHDLVLEDRRHFRISGAGLSATDPAYGALYYLKRFTSPLRLEKGATDRTEYILKLEKNLADTRKELEAVRAMFPKNVIPIMHGKKKVDGSDA